MASTSGNTTTRKTASTKKTTTSTAKKATTKTTSRTAKTTTKATTKATTTTKTTPTKKLTTSDRVLSLEEKVDKLLSILDSEFRSEMRQGPRGVSNKLRSAGLIK